jgi:DNA topoisomerase IA
MRAAQRLYENGYITYMRTDSTTLSSQAITAARELIGRDFGKQYLPDAPRSYQTKVKNAQEAHEAIRPAGTDFQSPTSLAADVGDDGDPERGCLLLGGCGGAARDDDEREDRDERDRRTGHPFPC